MALVSAPDSVRDWIVRHPTAVDAGIAVVLAAVAAPDLTDRLNEPGTAHSDASVPLAWIMLVGLIVPLVWRRRAPVAVFAAVAVVAFVQWLTVPPFGADAAVLVALYTVAAHERRRRRVIACSACALLGVALVLVNLPAQSDPVLSALTLTAFVAVALALGLYAGTRQRYVASVQQRAVDSERARIAREMHDIVAHSLAVMTALADGAGLTVRSDPTEAEGALRHISQTGRNAQAEMRRLLGVLGDRSGMPPSLAPQPGLGDLGELIEQTRRAGLDVRLLVTGDPRPVEEGVQLAAFRIVQEALSNALKHAATATDVEVGLRYGNGSLEVDVTNSSASRSGSYVPGAGRGIPGMRQRAAAYGAALVTGPRADGGWRVHTRLPLDGARS